MKLYEAVDRLDGKKSMFLVYDNGKVAVGYWRLKTGAEQEQEARINQHAYLLDPAERFNDAIDPVLIAEW